LAAAGGAGLARVNERSNDDGRGGARASLTFFARLRSA